MLVDADIPGWKRIVPAAGTSGVARPASQRADGGEPEAPGNVIAQVFALHYADVAKVDLVVKPFLTPGQ